VRGIPLAAGSQHQLRCSIEGKTHHSTMPSQRLLPVPALAAARPLCASRRDALCSFPAGADAAGWLSGPETLLLLLVPLLLQAHNKRATVLYLMEQYQESIEMCELVLELNPYHFAAASGMGMCYVKLADYKGALRAFQRTLQINPGLTHIQKYILALKDQVSGEAEQ
jgi:tetratricopeptide (TPR) repeat protein